MSTKTKLKAVGDLLIHCESLEYCTVPAIIRNNAATAVSIADILGQPLSAGTSSADYNLTVAGGEAGVIALLLDGPTPLALAATTNSGKVYQVLKNPPAIINTAMIKLTDGAGAALTLATMVTALKALKFECRTEPVKITTQTT